MVLWFCNYITNDTLYTNNIWYIWYACFEPKVTCMPVVYQNNKLTGIEPFIKRHTHTHTHTHTISPVQQLETQNNLRDQLI
jgi:hypothetical protein